MVDPKSKQEADQADHEAYLNNVIDILTSCREAYRGASDEATRKQEWSWYVKTWNSYAVYFHKCNMDTNPIDHLVPTQIDKLED